MFRSFVLFPILICSMLFWSAHPALSDPELVKDINPGTADGSPEGIVIFNDTLFFRARTAAQGMELWKSDGTEAGTVMVRDINNFMDQSSNPFYLTPFQGELFFSAYDGWGTELWKTDGTDAGTVRIIDINPNQLNSSPSYLTVVGTILYFAADQSSPTDYGFELWKSDGTGEGTVMVKDMYPGANDGWPRELLNHDDTLFFQATDGANGIELWKSDGTEEGTIMVKDINATGDSTPSGFTVMNGTLYFRANDGLSAWELWKTDGTEGGTVRITDIASTYYANIGFLTPVGDTLYFVGCDETNSRDLWKTQGVPGDETRVININPTGDSNVQSLFAHNGTIYFAANDGIHGIELWKSDGTEEGTVMVKDINESGNSIPGSFTVLGDRVFFVATDRDSAGYNHEVWQTDGTAEGTVMLADIYDSTLFSPPGNLTVLGDTLYFQSNHVDYGKELWKYKPTGSGLFSWTLFLPSIINNSQQ